MKEMNIEKGYDYLPEHNILVNGDAKKGIG